MFDQIPNRRITQRRQNLKNAPLAAVSLVAAVSEASHRGRMDRNTFFWSLVFVLSVSGYWKGRHEDPWNPPDVDAKGWHDGALERER